MAQQLINIGTTANDGTGDGARTGGAKINDNFSDLYARIEEIEENGVDGGPVDYNDIINKPALGSAATRNVGTSTGNLIEVLDGQKLPALDASNLVNVPGGGGGGGGAISIVGIPTAGQYAVWASANSLQGATVSFVADTRSISAGTGLTGGGDLSANRTISLSAGSIASLVLADTAVQPAITISAGTGLTGGGDLSTSRTLSLSSGSIASLALADTALQNTAVAFKTAIIAYEADGTEQPLIGDALVNLMVSDGGSEATDRISLLVQPISTGEVAPDLSLLGTDDDGVTVWYNGEGLWELLQPAQTVYTNAVSGNFTGPYQAYHTAAHITLNANSTITAITGLAIGETRTLFITNSDDYTLAESGADIFTLGSDALSISLEANKTTMLLVSRWPNGNYYIRNTGQIV